MKIGSSPAGISEPSISGFFATIHADLGIDYARSLYDGDRPVPIADMAHPITQLFA